MGVQFLANVLKTRKLKVLTRVVREAKVIIGIQIDRRRDTGSHRHAKFFRHQGQALIVHNVAIPLVFVRHHLFDHVTTEQEMSSTPDEGIRATSFNPAQHVGIWKRLAELYEVSLVNVRA